jgi:quercetin dioxygenase-like cupin family protein
MAVDEPFPGVSRRCFDAAGATVSNYTFSPEATFPVHRHAQEQITLIDQGIAFLRLGNETLQLGSGDWTVIPGGLEHGITAGPGGARVTAIVVPRRTDADAYEVLQQPLDP